MTTNSSNNFIHWNKRSGEGSKKQTISQCFLQSRNNHFTIRHRNLLPEQIQNQSSQKKKKKRITTSSSSKLLHSPWRFFPCESRQDREQSKTSFNTSSNRETLTRSNDDSPENLRRNNNERAAGEGRRVRRCSGMSDDFVIVKTVDLVGSVAADVAGVGGGGWWHAAAEEG